MMYHIHIGSYRYSIYLYGNILARDRNENFLRRTHWICKIYIICKYWIMLDTKPQRFQVAPLAYKIRSARSPTKPKMPAMPRTGKEKLQQVLDQATKARSKSIQLEGTQFADQLAQEIRKYANKMENYYAQLKYQVNLQSPNEAKMKELLSAIERKQAWYEKAEART